MEKQLTNLFNKVDQTFHTTSLLTEEIILQDLFTLQLPNQNIENTIILSLTNNFLCISNNKTFNTLTTVKQFCLISFDLKFDLMRENIKFQAFKGKEKKVLGNPFCLKFQKSRCKYLCVYSDKIDILIKWKNQLQKMINRKGFHDLFRPIKKIGKGNFASVYLAERLQDSKMVAVKAFSKQATFSQQKGKQALINEISILRKLNQQNVLKLFAVFQSDNSIYMTMQLLEGSQLFSKIQNKHKFTQQQTRHIMQGLLKGLQHMHSKRVMHRDLKPQNIMIKHKNSCDVVIVDFGLAAWADQQTYLFVRCGTPGYVAPQIINIKDMSTKSSPICDIFSVGLIFHILLMGRAIFPGKTYNQVLNQNRACDFNLNHKDYSEICPQSHNLLIRMLDKNPQTRISASQALNHVYFSCMQIQQPLRQYQMVDIIQINSKQQFDSKPKLLNKLSISSSSYYNKTLKPSTINNCKLTYTNIHKNRITSKFKENISNK